METSPFPQQRRESLTHFLSAGGIALFAVIFLWGIFESGLNAFGFNATVFFLLLPCLFYKTATRKFFPWFLPFFFMAASFSLYENPWLKTITIFVLPAAFVFLVNYSALENRGSHIWNFYFLETFSVRLFSFFSKFSQSAHIFSNYFFPHNERTRHIVKRSLLGLSLFLILAILVVIPLLSSADPLYAQFIREALQWFFAHFSWETFWKIVLWVMLTMVFLSMLLSWGMVFSVSARERESLMDPIASGIVLAGILGLYVLFLATQVGRLWVHDLPVNFQATESFVKSGFWQLFALSIINVVLFFVYYRRTNALVQKILLFFTVSSLLLVVSAAQRMYLYVTLYGLSYEKFFASYTVLYAMVLFICLLFFLFRKRKTDIFKFLTVTFLWMFSVATILPVEQIIFRANVSLSHRQGSRIHLHEMEMLSNDVLPLVERSFPGDPKWHNWQAEQYRREQEKSWYEKNLVNMLH